MTATPDTASVGQASASQTGAHRDWDAELARRTTTLGGGEITAILALAGASGVITFSGGFPDPATFPTQVLADIAARLITEDPGVALQYAATECIAGVRLRIRSALLAAGPQARRGRTDDH